MHGRRGEESVERTTIDNNTMRKRSLGRSRLRLDDCVSIGDVGTVKPGVQQREAEDEIDEAIYAQKAGLKGHYPFKRKIWTILNKKLKY